ncbi:MAG: hypothetical protein RLZ98_486 [Pseudomonadota bacterium]|jgi:NTE family protein
MQQRTGVRRINLALQGGGAHGAFAWGVLDRLLEEESIEIDGICATSAGTMNACAVAYGMHLGSHDGTGREKAREKLASFWHAIHEVGQIYSPIRRMPWHDLFGGIEFSPGWLWFDGLTRMVSPYQSNPFDFNPLREVLARSIDFDQVRACNCVKLFISATNVRTGQVHVFNAHRLTIDVALASACLPFIFKAVEIDGEHYWDGGYMGNPALFPLFYETECRDVMIVHINPITREDVPTTAPEIMNRINEISFNSSLLKELRAIAFVKKLKQHDMLKPSYAERFRDVLVHSIRAEEAMSEFSAATKFDTSWPFLTQLRDRGRKAMSDWLEVNFDYLGVRDTVDLHSEFLTSVTELFEPRKQPAGPA